MLNIDSNIIRLITTRQINQYPFWSKSASLQYSNSVQYFFVAWNSLHCSCLAMKLLLTPRATQNVVEEIPVVPGFIPVKSDVHILCCMDGQTFNEHHHVPFDYPYYTELFLKLCTRNNHVVQRVHLSVISFFEGSANEFAERLRTCDLFFFAGFNRHAEHVESIFKKTDESMNEKRTAVANRVVTNQMAMWAVGASAIFCGSLWNCQFGGMPSTTHVMFGLLGPQWNRQV